MKKIVSLIVIAVLLLSMFSVSALAADAQPTPTVGPAEMPGMYGSARVGLEYSAAHIEEYVVNYNYRESKLEVYNDAIPGMTYDLATNTCTISNVHEADNELFIWYMGNDFKLRVEGENELGAIYVYNYHDFHGTSLNIVGDGTLTVNEKRAVEEAIFMFNDGDNSIMQLDIADSVTVHLYSQENPEDDEDGEKYMPVVTLNETGITPAQGGAITVGGKTAPEVKSKQIVKEKPDTLPVLMVDNPNEEVGHGMQVRRKSDPDGVYAMMLMDDVVYMVMHYVYVPAVGTWMADPGFSGDRVYSGKRYTKEEFEAEYEYVTGIAPTPIRFTDEWQEKNLGETALKLTKDGEPDAIYAGVGYWEDYSYTGDPDGYMIYPVTWNEKEEIYVQVPSVSRVFVSFDKLEQKGYHSAVETNVEQLELEVWAGSPTDEDRWQMTGKVLKRRSEPDALFVESGTYTDSDGEEGVTLYRVHYDPAAEEHYILYGDYSSKEFYSASNETLENDTDDFYYAYDEVTRPVELRFVEEYFDFDNFGYTGTRVKNSAAPGVVYAYDTTYHYLEGDNYRIEHTLYRLTYNEKKERYYTDPDFDDIDFTELSEIELMGYEVVNSEQPLEYTTKGSVWLEDLPLYTDKSGKKYYVDYYDNVFSYSEENTVTLSDGKHYLGTLMPDLSVDSLNDTIHEIVTDNYAYWISGPEYHHIGGEAPQPQKYTLSGKLTSFLSDADYVYIKLLSSENWEINMLCEGDVTEYEIGDVPAGTYTMTVSKKDHVSREYSLTVSADTTQDVKLHPAGDINGDGKVTTIDFGRANSHARGKSDLEGYEFSCADVNGDNKVSTADAGKINSHARGKSMLW